MEHLETFDFAGHEIRVVVKELDQNAERNLKNWLSGGSGGIGDRTLVGNCEDIVLREGVKALYVDNKQRPVIRRNAQGVEELDIPNYRDREARMSLSTKLLYVIVKHNDFLGFWDPFKAVFSTYLPEEDLDEATGEVKEDPTGRTVLSPNGYESTSGVRQIPHQ